MIRGRLYELIRIIVISILANAICLTLLTFFLGDLRFPNEHKTVYTTRTGECYHLSGCSGLSWSKYETTIGEAVSDGYRPCGNCDPPAIYRNEFHFDRVHYFVLVPCSALFAFIGSLEALWLDIRHPSLLYLAHLALSVLLSMGFEALI